MRIECSACEEVYDAKLAQVVEQVVRFMCSHCGAESELPAQHEPVPRAVARDQTKPVLRSAAATSSRLLCPKCAAPIAAQKGCGSCGLQLGYFESYRQEAAGAGQEVEVAWTRLLEQWHSTPAHQAFAQTLAEVGDYRAGVILYRREAESAEVGGDLQRKEACQNMLQSIQEMASASLLLKPRAAAPEKKPYKTLVVLLFVLVLIGAASGIYFVIKKSQETPIPQVTPPSLLQAP